jgi:hypothetical protein
VLLKHPHDLLKPLARFIRRIRALRSLGRRAILCIRAAVRSLWHGKDPKPASHNGGDVGTPVSGSEQEVMWR